jgi:hypothetical protein
MSRTIFWVDIPDSSRWQEDEMPFINIRVFDTKEGAVTFCKEYFGADEDGKISLITEGTK